MHVNATIPFIWPSTHRCRVIEWDWRRTFVLILAFRVAKAVVCSLQSTVKWRVTNQRYDNENFSKFFFINFHSDHFQVVGLQLCEKTIAVTSRHNPKTVSPMLDLAQVAEASTKLLALLDQVVAYVEDVINGKQQPDNSVGRSLLDLINSVPHMSTDQFAAMFNSNVKDLLMVVTLSQLIKTQLQLNEKLTFLTTNWIEWLMIMSAHFHNFIKIQNNLGNNLLWFLAPTPKIPIAMKILRKSPKMDVFSLALRSLTSFKLKCPTLNWVVLKSFSLYKISLFASKMSIHCFWKFTHHNPPWSYCNAQFVFSNFSKFELSHKSDAI